MALPSALDIIERRESGGRNIRQQIVPQSVSSASGHFQMIKPTWQAWAKAVGIDTNRYPEAISAPYELQRKAAAYGFRTQGFRPWEATKHLVGQEKNYSAGPGVLDRNPTTPAPGGGRSFQQLTGLQPLDGGTAAAPAALAHNREELQRMLLAKYPELRVTSGYRDPGHNKRVGGAKGSQHIHDRAIDVSVRDLPPEKQEEIARYARSIGARGFGYYPGSQSMHFDVRPSGSAFWGPNYSRTSLGQTAPWFQKFASEPAGAGGGASATTEVAAAPAGVLNQNPTQPQAPPPNPVDEAITEMQAALTPPPQPQPQQAPAPAISPMAPSPAPNLGGPAASMMASLIARRREPQPLGFLDAGAV